MIFTDMKVETTTTTTMMMAVLAAISFVHTVLFCDAAVEECAAAGENG